MVRLRRIAWRPPTDARLTVIALYMLEKKSMYRLNRLASQTFLPPIYCRMVSLNGIHSSSSKNVLKKIEINVDCGEAFGSWVGGPDEELMPLIDAANVACGGHAGDPVTMRKTVALAKQYGIKVGAREFKCSRRAHV